MQKTIYYRHIIIHFMPQQEKVLVSLTDGLSFNKRINLHITVALLSFMSMVFHFTTVYFFTLQLDSLFLVGIFLGLWNLFAFLLDVPIGILQYYYSSRQLYAFWVLSQILAMLIFTIFIFSVTDYLAAPVLENIGVLEWVLSFFIFDIWNIILLLIAALCYGFTKEVNDITTISYVLNNAHPSQYKSIIAKNNIFFGLGSFLGLFVAGIVLTFHPKFIVFHILFMIALVFLIMYYFFDNSKKIVDIKNISKFYVGLSWVSLQKTVKNVWETVSKVDIKKTLEGSKYIILLPSSVLWKAPSFRELVVKTKHSFRDIRDTLFYAVDTHMIVYWSFIMLLTFGFWDTFASTFLIDFLDQVKPWWSFVLLGLVAIPAFWLQSFFWNLSDKVWGFKLSLIWLFLSGSSLMIMAFFVSSLNIQIIVSLALINSVWYSICMSISIATFLESYNVAYADKKWLKQIDASASAAPMKILQNLANVIGLFLGWMILGFAWFAWFFFVFGLFIICFFVWSILWRWRIETVK